MQTSQMLIQSVFQVKILYVWYFVRFFITVGPPAPSYPRISDCRNIIWWWIFIVKSRTMMSVHICIHFYFSSTKILSSPIPCFPTRLVCCIASPTFAAAHKLCMSQSTYVFPYSCFYLPVCSRLVPYNGRIELFIFHYGAVQKNNLTSVLTPAS